MTVELTEDTAMKNTLLLITLALFFSLNLTGCSLFSSSEDEQETATVSEEQASQTDEFASDDFEDGDNTDSTFDPDSPSDDQMSSSNEELASDDVEVEDSFGEDNYPDDDYSTGGSAPEQQASSDDYIDDSSFGSDDSLVVDEGGLPDSAMTENQEEDLFGGDTEPVAPIVDTPVFADNSFSDSEPVYDVPQFVPVKKIKPAAYQRAGANINRLYVVRSGDDMVSISQKLFGSDRSEDLYAYNSHFRGKSLKVGDKVYYPSPNNPNDQTMLTYYEDNNIPPQYYTSQEGDNIRVISKNLLGHERSWMEVYATNSNVESKDRLPAGLQIRYWPEGGAAPMPVAQNDFQDPPMNEPVAEPQPMDEPPAVAETNINEEMPDEMGEPKEVKLDEPQEVAQLDEPEPMDDPMIEEEEDFNPPPAAGTVGGQPPKAVAPPPPPPPAPRAKFNQPPPADIAPEGGGDSAPLANMGEDSTIMAALGGLLILAFVIMLIFIRRSRSKRVNFSQTQV